MLANVLRPGTLNLFSSTLRSSQPQKLLAKSPFCVSAAQSVAGYPGHLPEIDQYSLAGLRREAMPKHVAIILDGNRRWHKARGRDLSYVPFFKANLLFAELCLKWGIGFATSFIYAFENLRRSKEANDLIFADFESFLEENLDVFKRKKMRVMVIGETDTVSKSLQDKLKEVEETTKAYSNLNWKLAVCYGGTRDIVQATRKLCNKAKAGLIEPEDVDEALMSRELWTAGDTDPDLLIRTGGYIRISNYLMWQLAQTELFFTNILAPEFEEAHFMQALAAFQQRNRTFGK